jgi:hypothetical protein
MSGKFHRIALVLLIGGFLVACMPVQTIMPVLQPTATITLPPTATVTATNIPAVPKPTPLSVEDWKSWPILPVVSENAKTIYLRGLTLGNDPHHFSVFGDCQSMANVFMARYDEEPDVVAGLPANLQETISNFPGSFKRIGPSTWPGTTFGALLWDAWIDRTLFNYCPENETALDCELRVWNPSIALINIGTHWDARNYEYLQRMLQQFINRGVLPVLAFKADNREGDERLNREIAQAAIEFDLPVWNFYRAASALENNGLKHAPDDRDIYLTDQGLELHRYSALEALNAVWRQLTGQ